MPVTVIFGAPLAVGVAGALLELRPRTRERKRARHASAAAIAGGASIASATPAGPGLTARKGS